MPTLSCIRVGTKACPPYIFNWISLPVALVGQRLADHFEYVVGQAGAGRDLFQRRLHVHLQGRQVAPPAVHAARQPRRHLRVERVEGDDLLGPERIRAAVGGVELRRVAVAEVEDQAEHHEDRSTRCILSRCIYITKVA